MPGRGLARPDDPARLEDVSALSQVLTCSAHMSAGSHGFTDLHHVPPPIRGLHRDHRIGAGGQLGAREDSHGVPRSDDGPDRMACGSGGDDAEPDRVSRPCGKDIARPDRVPVHRRRVERRKGMQRLDGTGQHATLRVGQCQSAGRQRSYQGLDDVMPHVDRGQHGAHAPSRGLERPAFDVTGGVDVAGVSLRVGARTPA